MIEETEVVDVVVIDEEKEVVSHMDVNLVDKQFEEVHVIEEVEVIDLNEEEE